MGGSIAALGDTVDTGETANLIHFIVGCFLGALCLGLVLALTRGIRGGDREVIDRAVRRERTRIARELHDVLGHRLVVIGLYARMLPESVRAGARAIDGLARVAMQDVRQVVGALNANDPAVPEQRGFVSADVTDMARRLPEGRVLVHFDGPAGAEREVPAATRRAVLRIVQECLTNAIKHGTGVVVVRVAFGDQLAITVDNEIGAARGDGTGLGLRGIELRAAELGGTAWWGETAGWFRVHVTLPVADVADVDWVRVRGVSFDHVLGRAVDKGECHA